jgi:hypothetical protein
MTSRARGGLHAVQLDYVSQKRAAIGARLGVHAHERDRNDIESCKVWATRELMGAA